MIDTPNNDDTTVKNEQPQDLAVINIDGVPYSLNDLSDNIKQLVRIYDAWSKEEGTAQLELMKIQSAKSALSNQIIAAVKAEKEEKQTDAQQDQVAFASPPTEQSTGDVTDSSPG